MKFQPLSEYLDYLRDSELNGVRQSSATAALFKPREYSAGSVVDFLSACVSLDAFRQVVRGGMDNITDPIEMRAAMDTMTDVNYYFFGSPLFDNCAAAAAGVPAAVQRIVNMASGDDKTMLQDFIDNPQFVLGESGSGFPFHQHGEAILQLLTGRKRWWLLDAGQTPPSGYRYDMSQLKWIQQTLPKLPPSLKPWTCTQERRDPVCAKAFGTQR